MISKYYIISTGTEDQHDIKIYKEFQELHQEVKKLNNLTSPKLTDLHRLVVCHKDMYNLGKLKNVSPLLLYEILGDGFMSSVRGYKICKNKDLKEEFVKECETFAKAAEKIQTLFGFSVPNQGVWEKRKNFENWIKN